MIKSWPLAVLNKQSEVARIGDYEKKARKYVSIIAAKSPCSIFSAKLGKWMFCQPL